jgi:hypothetical protein
MIDLVAVYIRTTVYIIECCIVQLTSCIFNRDQSSLMTNSSIFDTTLYNANMSFSSRVNRANRTDFNTHLSIVAVVAVVVE